MSGFIDYFAVVAAQLLNCLGQADHMRQILPSGIRAQVCAICYSSSTKFDDWEQTATILGDKYIWRISRHRFTT